MGKKDNDFRLSLSSVFSSSYYVNQVFFSGPAGLKKSSTKMTVKVSKPHLDDRAGRPPEKRTFVGADT